jgi:hypothetical protein
MRAIILLFVMTMMTVTGILGVMSRPASASNARTLDEQTHIAYLPHLSGALCGRTIDTFDDPTSGWFTGRRDTLTAEYLDGEYRFMVTQPMTVWLVVAPGCARTNYRAEIDARWAGRPGNFYALMLDIRNGVDGSYLFAVNTDKRVWLVMQIRGGDLDFVIPETGNDAILPGGQVNRLAAERRGDTIFLFINDTPVGELRTGQSGSPVAAGLAVGTYTDVAPADARFDNYLYADTASGSGTPNGELRAQTSSVFGPFPWPGSGQ